MTTKKKRVAFLETHPIQYKAPLLAYINKHTDIEIEALYLTDISLRGSYDPGFKKEISWDIDLLEGYRAQFIGKNARRAEPKGFFSLICPEIWQIIRSNNYDALIINGHNYLAYQIALIAAMTKNIPVFMRCDAQSNLERSGLRSLLRKPVMSLYYKFFSGFLAIGSANSEYYQALGVSLEKIHLARYAIDNARFSADAQMTVAERTEVRKKLGVEDGRPIILYCGKFLQRKCPDDLVKACIHLADQGLIFHLAMAGSGEMKEELEALCRRSQSLSCSFPGFFNQTEIPRLLAASDLFVLPSRSEPWGLALNEAMAVGLPVVSTYEVGASRDLIKPSVNGGVFKAGDIADLERILTRFISDDAYRASAGQESKKIIEAWSYQSCAQSIRDVFVQRV